MIPATSSQKWLPFILALILLAVPSQVRANGLPLAASRSVAGGALHPAVDSPVGVVREHLLLDLREQQALIRATYVLRNLASDAIALTIAFPVPHYEEGRPGAVRPSVLLDGEPLSFQRSQAPVTLGEEETHLPAAWLDPFTGEPYEPPLFGRQDLRPAFLTFSAPFAPGQERRLEVSYSQDPGRDFSRFFERALRYDYLLQPARHWASFGELEVEVLVPPGRVIRSLPPLTARGNGSYGETFSGLPEQNLSVFVAPQRGRGMLSSWWWQRTGRAWILAAITVAGGLAGGLLRRQKPGFLHFLGTIMGFLVATLVFALTPLFLFQPSPAGMMQTWFLFVPLLGLLFLVANWLPGRITRAAPPPPSPPPEHPQ